LFNAGSEWNESSLVYETNFRDYDPAIGRFYANDPLSLQGHSLTPYRFGFNNPVSFNDPTGLYEQWDDYLDRKQSEYKISEWQRLGLEFISSDVVRGGSWGGFREMERTTTYNITITGYIRSNGRPNSLSPNPGSTRDFTHSFSLTSTETFLAPDASGMIRFATSGQNGGAPAGGGPVQGGFYTIDQVLKHYGFQSRNDYLFPEQSFLDRLASLFGAESRTDVIAAIIKNELNAWFIIQKNIDYVDFDGLRNYQQDLNRLRNRLIRQRSQLESEIESLRLYNPLNFHSEQINSLSRKLWDVNDYFDTVEAELDQIDNLIRTTPLK